MKVENSLTSVGLAVMVVVTLGVNQNANAVGVPTFSTDVQGPTVGTPPSWGPSPLINGHDILSAPLPGPPLGTPSIGPLPSPGIFIPGAAMGITPTAYAKPVGVGIPPLHLAELDALSYGRDQGEIWYFSVDEFATGLPGSPISVSSEASIGEASADVFGSFATGFNFGVLDGDGFGGLPGVGLVEPNPPSPFSPDPGDNLDALNMDTTPNDIARVFFSLDTFFPDPLESAAGPPNFGTAPTNGFSAADVIVFDLATGSTAVYAPAAILGLDPGEDDIDALVLLDNGNGDYEAGVDKIAFSIRRGSGTIGMIDATLGIPIEEGDILEPVLLGTGGMGVGILVKAEDLGLATIRSGTAGVHVIAGQTVLIPDELDALDLYYEIPEPTSLVLLSLGGIALLRRK